MFLCFYVSTYVLKYLKVSMSRYILDGEGWMFVAGNSKNMPTQVRRSLISALTTRLGTEEAEKFVEKMENVGRYQTETWS